MEHSGAHRAQQCIIAAGPLQQVIDFAAEHLGEVAFRCGLLLHELSLRRASLAEAYRSLTKDAVEYRAPHLSPDQAMTWRRPAV
jgi:hypothetical protein